MAERGSASKTVQGGVRQYRPEEAAWRPWLVPLLVVACVVVFVVEMFVNNCPGSVHPLGSCVGLFLHRFSFQPLRENPLLGPSSYTLEKMGALQWYKIVHQHQAWRLVTCIWLHAGLVHLLANMLSLLFIGIRLEQQFGFVRIGVIYLLSGFGGAIVSALFLRNGVTVGASGPLFGILGAILSELIINWTVYSNKVVVLLTILFLIIINMAIGLLPYVDNFAHVGGFISGFLLGFVLLIQPHIGWIERHDLPPSARITYKYRAYQYCLWVVALLLLITGYAVSLVMLFRE